MRKTATDTDDRVLVERLHQVIKTRRGFVHKLAEEEILSEAATALERRIEECERLRADQERIDWYEQFVRREVGFVGYFHGERLFGISARPETPENSRDVEFVGKTLRAAIDAARKRA